jgi:hypothetical protein
MAQAVDKAAGAAAPAANWLKDVQHDLMAKKEKLPADTCSYVSKNPRKPSASRWLRVSCWPHRPLGTKIDGRITMKLWWAHQPFRGLQPPALRVPAGAHCLRKGGGK